MIRTVSTTASDEEQDAQPLKVSIQGVQGAFHQIAAQYCFEGKAIEVVPAETFIELVEQVEAQQKTDVGIMAIENTVAGSILQNYSLIQESALSVTGEVYLRIKQNLMALPGQSLEDLVEVRSHPMAIAQCRVFFRQYPHIRLIETTDTALSARKIKTDGIKGVGAIASTLAAELYGLEILAPGIETNKKNHTRFLVLEKKEPVYSEKLNKISLCFSVDHEVGSLYKVLGVLAAYNVNMTKIQSAPIVGKPWEYRFFLDFVVEGKLSFAQAIDAIRPITHDLKVLGMYQKGAHFEY